ncbi:hypothetical protein OGM63_06315 [Plectonema radiosum NIES-515]|uniref:Uncharacterized protein n=1 Tax=Plectonema radiosum NIES-515 TaxID=2986073 RepID=A0ABT3AVK6_9CYAN|nr:hypothetical protein [Plectonema radiosum]MCV3213141.1 hypothetical protein [Plectonema radiosum NIES-515]
MLVSLCCPMRLSSPNSDGYLVSLSPRTIIPYRAIATLKIGSYPEPQQT